MPLDIAAAAHKIASDAMDVSDGQDARSTLSAFDRDIIGGDARPSLCFPLRDPVEFRQHLKITIATLTELLLAVERHPGKDRSALLLGKMTIKGLNKKLNAKRRL